MSHYTLKDPDSDVEYRLLLNDESREILDSFFKFVCPCNRSEVRKRTYSNGSKHFVEQCLVCGRQIKNIGKNTIIDQSAINDFDENLSEEFEKKRRRIFYEKMKPHADEDKERNLKRSEEYAKYLDSVSWKAKRQKVLIRADGICEGCLEMPATQVHHLTYEHVFDELLFELVAICDSCHAKAHEEAMAIRTFEAQTDETQDNYSGESICYSCRNLSSDENHRDICGAHELLTEIALISEKYCGPNRNSFEGLK